ncbi:MAG: hypothetical protein FWB88_00960 [Defluviitaleaceae bacterium]|nr:hypothetical protein [Defluviitaleaceae bacterium]MCL2238366.1 hypothetical protein [Defluviitaleaceae bacterium]
MGTGFLEVVTSTGIGALPLAHTRIIVSRDGNVVHEFLTDESGIGESVPLEAPEVALTLDVEYYGVPYSLYDVRAEAPGFMTTIIRGVEILDTETSILPINMLPATEEGGVNEFDVGVHNLTSTEDRHMERPGPFSPRVLSEVIIPEFITVHLGRPDRVARNVRVPFVYYIKNVCSHEIYATWPAASLEANIYCQISLALNRIFTNSHRLGRELRNRWLTNCQLKLVDPGCATMYTPQERGEANGHWAQGSGVAREKWLIAGGPRRPDRRHTAVHFQVGIRTSLARHGKNRTA